MSIILSQQLSFGGPSNTQQWIKRVIMLELNEQEMLEITGESPANGQPPAGPGVTSVTSWQQ